LTNELAHSSALGARFIALGYRYRYPYRYRFFVLSLSVLPPRLAARRPLTSDL
jgi:hypothetical protein